MNATATDIAEKIEILKTLRLASPISAFTFWNFELVEITEREGIPHPLLCDIEPMFKAGMAPRDAASKLAKRWM